MHRFAVKKGIKVVRHAWLFDSLAAGRRLPESDYSCASGDGAVAARTVQTTHVEGTELHSEGSRQASAALLLFHHSRM